MRVISIGELRVEYELKCKQCLTVFAYSQRDCISSDGYNSCVQCPICRSYIHGIAVPKLPYN